MILPSEHLFAVRALERGLARVLANVIDWNLIQKTIDQKIHSWFITIHNSVQGKVYINI